MSDPVLSIVTDLIIVTSAIGLNLTLLKTRILYE